MVIERRRTSERGRAVLVEALLLEHDDELLVVTELEGCRHVDGFGDPVVLTFDEEWRLIEAALDVLERMRRVRPKGRLTRATGLWHQGALR